MADLRETINQLLVANEELRAEVARLRARVDGLERFVSRRALAPVALAGGDGASTIMSHLGAEHSNSNGLLGFLTHEQARYTLAGVCREMRREVDEFRWPLVILKGHTGKVNFTCALGDGRVVSASDDTNLRVWNVQTGACERLLEGHCAAVTAVCALANGRVVSASHDGKLLLWDTTTGACLRVLAESIAHVYSICASSDNQVVTASTDGMLLIWDIKKGGSGRALVGHTDDVLDVCAHARPRCFCFV